MVVTKNQIRPRRKKFHFTNADILGFDTLGVVQLVAPAPLGQALSINFIQMLSSIAVVYASVDAANPFVQLNDDFALSTFVEDIATSNIQNFTKMFASLGLNLVSFTAPELDIDNSGTFNEVGPNRFGGNWTDLADIAANGGIYLLFDNGGVDLTGGDPANYWDVYLDYAVVHL